VKEKDVLQRYINNVRRHLSKSLKPGIGLRAEVFPAEGPGAVVTLYLGADEKNIDTFKATSTSIAAALKNIKQNALAGDLANVNFGGTNLILEGNKVILIKGEDNPKLWTDVGSASDVGRILSTSSSSK
jgi:hypothetical protein